MRIQNNAGLRPNFTAMVQTEAIKSRVSKDESLKASVEMSARKIEDIKTTLIVDMDENGCLKPVFAPSHGERLYKSFDPAFKDGSTVGATVKVADGSGDDAEKPRVILMQFPSSRIAVDAYAKMHKLAACIEDNADMGKTIDEAADLSLFLDQVTEFRLAKKDDEALQ